jgi:hypothetical protein
MIPKLMNIICYRRDFDALERWKEDYMMMLMTRYIAPPKYPENTIGPYSSPKCRKK